MKLRILSDLHLGHAPTWSLPLADADAILCAGDLGVAAVNGAIIEAFVAAVSVPFFYVLGNHDAYHGSYESAVQFYRGLERKLPHFRLLHNETAQLGDYRLVGTPLWTDFALRGQHTVPASMDAAGRMISDFSHTLLTDASGESRFIEPQDLVGWHAAARRFLAANTSGDAPTIVLTHWSPSGRLTPDRFADSPVEPYFASDCEDLLRPNIKLWVHGHSHAFDDRVVGGTRLLRNPKGYPGEATRWDDHLVIEL